jgi:hypothetical protein
MQKLCARSGHLVIALSGALFAPFVAVISIQMRRIEGASPILTYTQLCSGSIGALFFIIPSILFGVAAYRPDRPPELILLLNDLAWFCAVMPVAAAFVQNVAIALLFAPGGLITFFKSGPFAWNGLLAF